MEIKEAYLILADIRPAPFCQKFWPSVAGGQTTFC